jgi:GT2 family glycosyltransferase
MLYSIIIPTYNHLDDYLKPCCESIKQYTTLENVEIIIVSNGCTDKTDEYINSLGKPFKLLSFKESLGYTKSINEGLKVAIGEYIILLNNDIVLNPQSKDRWIEILQIPFKINENTGITGPAKFFWDCGGIKRTAIGFWCCMFKRSLIYEIGILNEDYSPGMGEDGEFSVKAELLGYELVQVPVNTAKDFGEGLSDYGFPINHKGNGTFGEHVNEKNEIIERNNKILAKNLSNRLETIYNIAYHHECDINKLFHIFRRYANRCSHITEFGVRGVMSTWAYLSAIPDKMVSYDIYTAHGNIDEAKEVAKESNIDFTFIEQDVLTTDIEPTDLLFIDTLHTYKQLSQELKLHGNKARKYLLLHDTTTWGTKDEVETDIETKGLKAAINEFLRDNPRWKKEFETEESNGLTILKRTPKISIIVPTCNYKTDTLKICLTRIFSYTSLMDKEVIVVSNGCDNDTFDYLLNLRKKITILNLGPEKQGQIIPINEGAKAASGEFIVFIDDDSHLLPQATDTWINKLIAPFADPEVGMSGTFVGDYPYLGTAIHNGCTMYRRETWNKVSGFNISYGFGYLSDVDISFRIKEAGYRIIDVGADGCFPIYHPGSPVSTDSKQKRLPLIRKNRNMLYQEHGKKPKYSIVVPTYNHLEDCLKPCLESVKKFTKLEDVEVIVVANGCKDGTAEYVDSLGHPFKLVWFDEGLGFTKATNEGIKVAVGDYIVLLNNDAVILDYAPVNTWIEMLVAPFEKDEKVGITGPLQLYDQYADHHSLIYFCVMLKREILEELAIYEEI